MKHFNFARINTALALAALALSSPANAYFATLDTGEVLSKGQFQAMASPQFIFNRYDGANFSGRLDFGITEGVSARGILGFGKVDFQVGGMVKWVPFPDVDSQPAIGGEAGVIVARVGSLTQTSFRFHPLVSKRLETEIGDVTPYGSLPIGVTIQTGSVEETFTPVQLVGGAELRPLEMKNWSFFGELGLNISRSFGYLSAAVAYRFDETSMRK